MLYVHCLHGAVCRIVFWPCTSRPTAAIVSQRQLSATFQSTFCPNAPSLWAVQQAGILVHTFLSPQGLSSLASARLNYYSIHPITMRIERRTSSTQITEFSSTIPTMLVLHHGFSVCGGCTPGVRCGAVTTGLHKHIVSVALSPLLMRLKSKNAGSNSRTTVSDGQSI